MFEDIMKVFKNTEMGHGVTEVEYVIWPLHYRWRGQMLLLSVCRPYDRQGCAYM